MHSEDRNTYSFQFHSVIYSCSTSSSGLSRNMHFLLRRKLKLVDSLAIFFVLFFGPYISFSQVGQLSVKTKNAIISPGGNVTVEIYNKYNGAETSYAGVIDLLFTNDLEYVSSSSSPINVQSGKLSWPFNKTNNGLPDTISIRFHLPIVGDSVLALSFAVRLQTSVSDSAKIQIGSGVFTIVRFPYPSAKGPTKSVKWARTKTIGGINDGKDFSGTSSLFSIDTSSDGRYLYVAGMHELYRMVDGIDLINYTAKYSTDGLTIWERYDSVKQGFIGYPSIRHTSDGGCIWVCDTVRYDTILKKTGSTGVLVRKFDANGQLVWRKFIECANMPIIYENTLLVLPNDETLIAFETNTHTGELSNNLPDTIWGNVVLLKLSATGSIVWHKVYGGDGADIPYILKTTKSGEILVSGTTNSTTGTINGFSGSNFSQMHDPFIIKTTSDGSLIWSKTFSLRHFEILKDFSETDDGYLFQGYSKVRPSSSVDSLKNGLAQWLLKVGTNGNKISERIRPVYLGYEDAAYQVSTIMNCIQKANDGTYIICGSSSDYYGEIKGWHGANDVVVAKMSADGEIIWQKQLGGTFEDFGYAMIQDRKGDIFFVGKTGSVDDDIYENFAPDDGVMLVGRLGITNTISGKVFIDKNGNHIQDAGELLFNEGRINTYKTGDTTIARIFNGRFLNNVDTGTYTSVYTSLNNYYTVFPAFKSTSFTSFDQEDSVDFALIPKPGIKDLQISITPQTPARPGFNASYRIITKNIGTETVSNVVVKLAKSSKLTYLNSTRATSAVTADSITWAPLSLAAGAVDVMDVTVKLAVPPNLNNGDTLNLTAIAFPLVSDTTPTNNQMLFRQIAQGSYDPNDKTEAHAGVYTSSMKANAEPFQYLVRFQNTGTDTAFYITVKDTLDSRVDVKTLETISTSHPYKLSVDGNIATWQFDMIKLVDSTTNEPKSHGYISFSIQPKQALMVGDTVSNKAAIYFDYNLPIITNKAIVSLVSPGCPTGNVWLGTVSAAWENAANWSCGTVPTPITEVLIKAGTPFQPEISTTAATCKSIVAQAGAHVWVKVGARLNVAGK